MSTLYLPVDRIQDLTDGPGQLSRADDGKIMVWDNAAGRFAMQTLPQAGGQQIFVRGGGAVGGTSTIAGAEDFAGTLDPSTDGYAIIWDNTAGEFTMGTFEAAGAVAAHVAEADPHPQYLLEADYTPTPPGGSSTHVQYNNSGAFGGSSGFTYDGSGTVYVGTSLGVGTNPTAKFHVVGSNETSTIVQFAGNTSNVRGVSFSITVASATNGMGGFAVSPTLSPVNNASIVYGTINLATIAASTRNITNYYANFYRADVAADYTGTNTNLYTLFLQSPTLNSTSKPTNVFGMRYSNFGASGVTTSCALDIAAQSGSTNNYSLRTNTGLVEFGDIVTLSASSTARASLQLPAGASPTSPADGNIWYLTADRLKVRRSATTETIASGVTVAGGAATAGAAYGATEQAMLQAAYDAARAFGLLT